MSKYALEPLLAPRNGSVLRAIGITRISTLNQDPKSLADQQALLRQWVSDRYQGPIEWESIAGQGSGECVDRKQVVQAEALVESGRYDLVVMEDLSRHMRRVHAVLFCELCEDMETRLIAINDAIDTAKDWRLHAFFAAIKHEQSNKDTSDRIKRTLRNRFLQGEVVQFTIFGYLKPAGAKNDGDLQKDSNAERIYKEWFRMLDQGASYSEVADWLNALRVPVGPYSRTDKWTCQMVTRITHNPILKGIRVRNKRKSKRNNKTGKYKSVKALPEERLERYCPHLAFFEAEYYDQVIRKLDSRNAKYKAGQADGRHPCLGRPKKRTVWPGQHIYCSECGRMFRYGGHGQNDHLLCRGACEYVCWNGVTVDGPLAAQKLSAAIFEAIASLPDFDPALTMRIQEEAQKLDSAREDHIRDLARAEEKLDRESKNILAAVREGCRNPELLEELDRLGNEKKRVREEREELERMPRRVLELPGIDELRQRTRKSFEGLARESPEYGRLMRQLIPEILVYPYRLIDGGRVVLRAKFTLNLAPLLPSGDDFACLTASLSRVVQADLFDPPQRVAFREEAMRLRAQELTERQAAAQLGITVTAAQRAAALTRLMEEQGLTDPYVRLHEPPSDCPKLRRHLHPRYRLEPLPGYPLE